MSIKKEKTRITSKKKNRLKENRGITLSALVITIVVLIILATISIQAVFSDNGIIRQAEKAADAQANAEAADQGVIGGYEQYIANTLVSSGGTNSGGNNKEPLEITYTIEDIDDRSKAVKLSYPNADQTKQYEQFLEEMSNGEINFDITLRDYMKQLAEEEGVSYNDALKMQLEELGVDTSELTNATTKELEKLFEEATKGEMPLDMPIVRMQLEQGAQAVGITYEEALLEVIAGGPFEEEQRNQYKATAANNNMTYKECLAKEIGKQLATLGINFPTVSTEVTIGNTNMSVAKSEFIVARNGTYIVKAETDEQYGEIQIEVTGIEEEKFSEIYTATQEYTDKNGETATIPAGFAVGISSNINTIDNGLVITDAVDSQGYSIGNEFVWIPVASEAKITRTEFDSNGQATNSIDSSYTEPQNYTSGGTTYTGYEEEEEDYNEMKRQVLAYHGFYIGRYEAGDGTIKNGLRMQPTEAHTVVSQRGAVPYSYVPWGKAMDDPSEVEGESGAVYLSKNMYKNQASVTSTLIYGSQWDAMCRFIGDSNRTTATKNGVNLTGRIGDDYSKNIYDLAGNCMEWTMEADSTSTRVNRGGYCADDIAVSDRYSNRPDDGYAGFGFRPGLYISNPES